MRSSAAALPVDRPDAPGSALGLVHEYGGTDRYMAPERLALENTSRSERAHSWFGGAAADVYSLGCVLVHVLLGIGVAGAELTHVAAARVAAARVGHQLPRSLPTGRCGW